MKNIQKKNDKRRSVSYTQELFCRHLFFVKILFLILLPEAVISQYSMLSKSEALEDLAFLHQSLQKWHPSYFRYTTPSSYNTLYTKFSKMDKDSISYRAFRYKVCEWVKTIRCGHTAVGHADAPARQRAPKIIPLEIWHLDGKIYVRDVLQDNNNLSPGDEILTLNNLTGTEILDTLMTVITGDGFQNTHVHSMLEKYFLFYYNHVFGTVDSVVVSAKQASGNVVWSTLHGIELPTNRKKPMRFEPDSTSIIMQGGGLSLHTIEGNPDTYVMRVTSFAAGSQRRVRAKIFRYLKKKQAKNIVLDVRGNGGGNVFRGYALASKLLPESRLGFQFGKKIHTAIFNSDFETNLGNRMSAIGFMFNPLQYPLKGLWMHYFPIITSKKNSFHGEVYVLADGGTFSMGSAIASLMKYKRDAIVIGEESGGSAYGSGAMITGAIRLPNSGIPINFNLYWLIVGGPAEDFGRGVQPDISTRYSLEDLKTGRDVDLETALEVIKSGLRD